jgi:hypothetical protein
MQSTIIAVAIIIILILVGAYMMYHMKFSFHKAIKNLENGYGAQPVEIFNQLDWLMDSEMAYSIELPYEGKDIKRITNFEESLLELTTSVVAALSPVFKERAINAGISEEFIYTYITRGCTIRLLAYMKETNAGIHQSNETEEEEEA